MLCSKFHLLQPTNRMHNSASVWFIFINANIIMAIDSVCQYAMLVTRKRIHFLRRVAKIVDYNMFTGCFRVIMCVLCLVFRLTFFFFSCFLFTFSNVFISGGIVHCALHSIYDACSSVNHNITFSGIVMEVR